MFENVDPNWILAVITFVALASSVITTILTLRHDTKIRNQSHQFERNDSINQHKDEIIESYIAHVADYIGYQGNCETFAKYEKEYALALLYLSDESAQLAKDIDAALSKSDYQLSKNLLVLLVDSINRP